MLTLVVDSRSWEGYVFDADYNTSNCRTKDRDSCEPFLPAALPRLSLCALIAHQIKFTTDLYSISRFGKCLALADSALYGSGGWACVLKTSISFLCSQKRKIQQILRWKGNCLAFSPTLFWLDMTRLFRYHGARITNWVQRVFLVHGRNRSLSPVIVSLEYSCSSSVPPRELRRDAFGVSLSSENVLVWPRIDFMNVENKEHRVAKREIQIILIPSTRRHAYVDKSDFLSASVSTVTVSGNMHHFVDFMRITVYVYMTFGLFKNLLNQTLRPMLSI